jgi:hypothetical protein
MAAFFVLLENKCVKSQGLGQSPKYSVEILRYFDNCF